MSRRPAKVRRLQEAAGTETVALESASVMRDVPEQSELSLRRESEPGTPRSDGQLQHLLDEARAEVTALRSQLLVSRQSDDSVRSESDNPGLGIRDTKIVNWTIFKDDRLISEFNPSDLSQMRVITDRGTAFTSHSFRTFCLENGIKHILNAVATPRANGQCERYNRTILASLSALNGGLDDDTWDIHVKTVQRGLNCTVNRAIGMTPSELLFGVKPRTLPESIILNELQDEINRIDLSSIRQEVKNRLDEDQCKAKLRFDSKRAKAKRYAVGELVLVRVTSIPATGESKKLNPRYKGPYKISAVLPNDRYEVVDMMGRRLIEDNQ
ncbi:hypothetical protein NQ317_008465 [Molorchus minor]|uniref:Integrase catalytic domain-containing protein n=1 Tax=Molorchus minor TaxID=1323400 RepID=A0ABQ9JG18_9CUCU|nr:hypothetical protein NQ317_008465 [Molorchus minor]